MKNKDVAELNKKVEEGYWLTFSHIKSKDPNGIVQLAANKYDDSGSLVYGHLFADKNIKSVLRMAEQFFKTFVLKGYFDEPDTNLDYLINHGFEISIFCSKTEGDYYVLKVNSSEQKGTGRYLYSTKTLASNGVLAVLQDAERNWAQYVIKGLMGEGSAISYNPEKGWGNF